MRRWQRTQIAPARAQCSIEAMTTTMAAMTKVAFLPLMLRAIEDDVVAVVVECVETIVSSAS
jgi:hypothetical protein